MTIANQSEVFILQYVTTTLNASIEQTSRQFKILLAVADIKYNILGTAFVDVYIQNIIIQDFTLQFKHHSKDQPNIAKFTSAFKRLFHISHTITESVLKHNYLKSKLLQYAHFPLKNYHNLHFATTPKN